MSLKNRAPSTTQHPNVDHSVHKKPVKAQTPLSGASKMKIEQAGRRGASTVGQRRRDDAILAALSSVTTNIDLEVVLLTLHGLVSDCSNTKASTISRSAY